MKLFYYDLLLLSIYVLINNIHTYSTQHTRTHCFRFFRMKHIDRYFPSFQCNSFYEWFDTIHFYFLTKTTISSALWVLYNKITFENLSFFLHFFFIYSVKFLCNTFYVVFHTKWTFPKTKTTIYLNFFCQWQCTLNIFL